MNAHAYLKSFSVIHRFSISYYIKCLKNFSLSGHQMGYITCICYDPGISQEQLSSFLGLNKGAVAKGVRPLVESGYINRVQSSKDKRAYELYPTDKAKGIFSEALDVAQSFEAILVKGMTDKEQEMFKVLLDRACSNVMEFLPKKERDAFIPPDHPPCLHEEHVKQHHEHHRSERKGI